MNIRLSNETRVSVVAATIYWGVNIAMGQAMRAVIGPLAPAFWRHLVVLLMLSMLHKLGHLSTE
jgi:hypothetical protein